MEFPNLREKNTMVHEFLQNLSLCVIKMLISTSSMKKMFT